MFNFMFGNNKNDISPDDFEKYLSDKTYTVIDVRTREEYNLARIANCMIIDFYSSDFKRDVLNLDKDGNYILYCRSGSRSRSALSYMLKNGFKNVKHLDGGIIAWHSSGKKIINN